MGTHNQAGIDVAANAAATTHTHTNTAAPHSIADTVKSEKQQDEPEQLLEAAATEPEKHYAYLPKASAPPQVIIIPATQASTVATNAAKKIRRAFSMPRNPFRWSRKFKTSAATGSSAGGGGGGGDSRGVAGGGGGISNSAISSCVGGRANAGSTVSLSSYQAVGKDAAAGHVEAGGGRQTVKTNKNCDNKNQHALPQVCNKVETDAGGGAVVDGGGEAGGGGGNRVVRRSSLRKFLNRIAQHVSSSVNVGVSMKRSS